MTNGENVVLLDLVSTKIISLGIIWAASRKWPAAFCYYAGILEGTYTVAFRRSKQRPGCLPIGMVIALSVYR